MDNIGVYRGMAEIPRELKVFEHESAIGEWPCLESIGLGAADREMRRSFIGGSDANVILSGSTDRLLRLWLEKRGEVLPDDLSGSLAVMLGCWTEPFNRQWFERISGERIVMVGRPFHCPKYPWRRCTLDGVIEKSGAVWEAKHTSAFAKPDEILERYMPQLQHNMAVTGADRAILSVIFGNQRYEIIEVGSDWLYQLELHEAELQFWECVVTGEQPVAVIPPASPGPVGVREVSLQGNNLWAMAAADWLRHRDAAKAHASACSSIKEMVGNDVSRAFGHGIEAKRSKSGAITIRELAR